MNRSTGSKTEKRQDEDKAKDRYGSLIESLVQDEIRRLERVMLFEWQVELRALQAAGG